MSTFVLVVLVAIIVILVVHRLIAVPTEIGANQRAALSFVALPLGLMVVGGVLLVASPEARFWAERHQGAVVGCLCLLGGWALIVAGKWWGPGAQTLGFIAVLAAGLFLVATESGIRINWDKLSQPSPTLARTYPTPVRKPVLVVREQRTFVYPITACPGSWSDRLSFDHKTNVEFETPEPVDVRFDDGSIILGITTDDELGEGFQTQGLRFRASGCCRALRFKVALTPPAWRQ